MGRVFHRLMDTGVATYSVTTVSHIAIGIAVLVLAAWRIGLRLTHGAPTAPEAEPDLFKRASKLAHLAIYALMFLLPISGIVGWFGVVGPAAGAHELMTNLLMILVVGHVAAVVVHQFYWKTDLLARMR